jgi:transposase, IS5 family
MQKSTNQISFSSVALSKRKLKSEFFTQMNLLLDWTLIEVELKKYYNKGYSVAGRPSYSGLLLFKMSLLQSWYGLSDYEVEEKVNDSLSFMQFVELTLEDDVPDHSVLSRFRTALTANGAYDKLMNCINDQLEQKGILLKKGAIIDASITDSPRKPRGKKEFEICATEDRQELLTYQTDNQVKVALALPIAKVKIQSHVDTEAAWIKKAGKLRYGYKKHVATDEQGLVTAIITTAANESDMVHLEDVVSKAKLPKGSRVRADKGYSSEANRKYLKNNKLKDGIMHKALKNKPLTSHQQKFNKIVSQKRYRIERTFGGIIIWFKAGVTRYIGKAKTHTQHIMEAIAYNLYRSPGIVMSNASLIAKN